MNKNIEAVFARAMQSILDLRYASALDDFRWLHDHPDDDTVEYMAIRRNVVLTGWAFLGKQYPPALDALNALLEEKSARLAGGDSNPLLQGDIAAIRRVLAREFGN